MEVKKPFILKRFAFYMGKKKILLPLALVLSSFSAFLNILPFLLVWLIVREVLASPSSLHLSNISIYAWLGFASAFTAIVIYFLSLTSSHLAAFQVEVGIQKICMEKIMGKPLGFFEQYPSGKIRKIINDGAATTHSYLAHQLPDLAATLTSPVILLVLFFVIDWRMGAASLIPIVMGLVTMVFMNNTQGQKFQKAYLDSLEEMSSESVEYVRGIPVVKTFGQSIFSFKKFYNSIVKYKDMVYAYTLLWRKPMSFYTVAMQAAAFFLIPAAILLINNNETLSVVLSNFIFYIIIAPIFTIIFMRSMNFHQQTMIAQEAIDRIDALLEYPNMEFSENTHKMEHYDIEFQNVTFSYKESEKAAIDDITFRVNEGETVALVGPSGGGKTTLARLAARFWDTDQGEVLIGGINVKEFSKKELMQKISFVFQNTRLFKGTLRENIVFGKENLKEEEINRAIDLSQSREIIDNLPDGLESVIGSKGVYLSGGEQQRIALARAILKDAPIVLLDEATAFSDPENEELIKSALKELGKNKTTIMIAHRLATVKDADKIFVLENGKIIESGTHEELLQKGEIYKKMWEEYQHSIEWKI